jgi:oxalate decarboxylase
MIKGDKTLYIQLPSTSARLFFGLAFAALAGWVDAVGFVSLGSFYLSFMSGNTTQIAVAASAGHWQAFLKGGAIILSFFIGSFVGTLLADASGRFRLSVLLASEFALFGAAISLMQATPTPLALLPVAAAMGMQNHLRQLVGRADVGKTFVTGSLFSAGQSLARALTGKAPRAEWLAHLSNWLAFFLGAAGGAYALHRSSLLSNLYAIAALLALLALLTAPARSFAHDQDAEG